MLLLVNIQVGDQNNYTWNLSLKALRLSVLPRIKYKNVYPLTQEHFASLSLAH